MASPRSTGYQAPALHLFCVSSVERPVGSSGPDLPWSDRRQAVLRAERPETSMRQPLANMGVPGPSLNIPA